MSAPAIPLPAVKALDAAWAEYRDLRMLEHDNPALVDCQDHQAKLARKFADYMRVFDGRAAQ